MSAPGAILFLDDVAAGRSVRRERWLSHPRVVTAELRTGSVARVLLAAVRR